MPDDQDCDAYYDRGHLGEDWNRTSGDLGQPVVAIGDGDVIYAGEAHGWVGGVVMVRHAAPAGTQYVLPHGFGLAEGVVSLYGHLNIDELAVREGDVVSRGSLLGVIGPYPGGGPHLHWEVRSDPNYGVGCGYCTSLNCPSDAIQRYTWPTDFVQMNRLVAQTHQDPTTLAFGTTDGGFILADDAEGGLTARQTLSAVGTMDGAGELPDEWSNIYASAGPFTYITGLISEIRVARTADMWMEDAWSPLARPPLSGYLGQLCYYGGYLYALGSNSIYAAHVEADGSLGVWRAVGAPPLVLDDFRVCADQGYLFFTGGYSSYPYWSKRVFSSPIHADGDLGDWTELNSMPEAKHRHACAISNGYLFVVGGRLGLQGLSTRCYSARINDDGTIGSWQETADHPLSGGCWSGIAHFPLLAFGDALVTVGGMYHNDCQYPGWVAGTPAIYQCTVFADGTTSEWQQTGSLGTAELYNLGAAIDGDWLYAFGGRLRPAGGSDGSASLVIWTGRITPGGVRVRTASYAHDFTVPPTASGLTLSWDAAPGPGSSMRVRYRAGDDSSGTYTVWSPWFDSGPVAVNTPVSRVGYEVRATIDPVDDVRLRSVTLSYYNPAPGITPEGLNLPVNLGAGVACVYDEVVAGGVTTQAPLGNPPELPPGLDLLTSFDLSTTAVFQGLVQIMFDAGELVPDGHVAELLHYVDGQWETVTSFFDRATNTLWGWVSTLSPFVVATRPDPAGISEPSSGPTGLVLEQNRPNPFGAQTWIEFEAPSPSPATLTIHDASGRLVRTLLDATVPAGSRRLLWNGLNDAGERLPSGVYFSQVRFGEQCESRKMLLLR